ncbi:hypothetical protein S7711_01142 [Stachybotrys chartarum IBT 7711]|uniref:ZZ-type domain-containing protein n=1 Tax=Stachybotrys chartarum (strain CBS 109288 / IBT 7711) TaxID=1280523 RepID=A0A084AST5_STACB|nr:hypothetical protein S7711_01142 [Stachybotrys chartarum IBT 7711]KFA48884.1 hypothetical protein S40293_02547 [Stachybotrys chartarum IBT 40293]
MWPSTPSVDSFTRPRLAVALVSAVAAASVGYYAYQYHLQLSPAAPASSGRGLRRSNAVRRSHRPRRSGTASTSSSSNLVGDENQNPDGNTQGDNQPARDESGLEEWWNDPGALPGSQRAGHNIVNLLFRVSEDNARRNGCVHRGCQCNACGVIPIRGIRYRCANCADFDLCETCEAQGMHNKTHIFYKVKVPAPPFGARKMQPVWYTGDPSSCPHNLPKALISKLSRTTGFERPELEAFWEQWTFMACTEWRDDPDELCIAMDRKTFERCLVPTGGSRHAAPNLIHDRMFAFYDYNDDGLIGFTEFLVGLSYRKQQDKLRKVFEGYDIDADGYVSRRDFLRMFRAYYVLYKQMHRDILDGLSDEALGNQEAHTLITSRQPLSSHFGREGRLPEAENNLRFEGKTLNPDGSVDVAPGYENVVVEDQTDTAGRSDILTSLFAFAVDEEDQPAPPQLVTHDDEDNDWRTVSQFNNPEVTRAYARALLNPPSTLDEIPQVLLGATGDGGNISEPEWLDDDSDEENSNGEGPSQRPVPAPSGTRVSESQIRAEALERSRRKDIQREQNRRAMARDALHDRWKRRQFYLDEEEGGSPPDDWSEGEDILESNSKAPEYARSPHLYNYNGSSSKAVATELEEDEPSHEELPSFLMPEAEHDAGKEILYQVTQQAFNELLDSIFKPAEDLAVQAAETKEVRQRFKHILDVTPLHEPKDDEGIPSTPPVNSETKNVAEKTLGELLAEIGFEVKSPEPVDEDTLPFVLSPMKISTRRAPDEVETVTQETVAHVDFTWPQFRPNSDALDPSIPPLGPYYPVTGTSETNDGTEQAPEQAEYVPTPTELQYWKRLDKAEATASERGGWGLLTFEEFEAIYHEQEEQGNRLDYLGSWIDFCIR